MKTGGNEQHHELQSNIYEHPWKDCSYSSLEGVTSQNYLEKLVKQKIVPKNNAKSQQEILLEASLSGRNLHPCQLCEEMLTSWASACPP